MSFDRLRVQQECEKLVGCKNLTDWTKNRDIFESLVLTSQQELTFTSAILEDGKDLYYKGLLSLSEAIQSMNRHLFSWATVKAYFSVYYLLRSSLALNGYAIVRNKCLYLIPIKAGSKPIKKLSNRYRNDHLCVINVYSDLYAGSDILQSNDIDGINSYEWMMDRRNQINYRQRQFNDPEPPDFLQLIAKRIDSNDFDELITTYVGDTSYLYCFQPEHACLALPIRRLLLTKQDFNNHGITLNLTPDRLDLITLLLSLDSKKIVSIKAFILPTTN